MIQLLVKSPNFLAASPIFMVKSTNVLLESLVFMVKWRYPESEGGTPSHHRFWRWHFPWHQPSSHWKNHPFLAPQSSLRLGLFFWMILLFQLMLQRLVITPRLNGANDDIPHWNLGYTFFRQIHELTHLMWFYLFLEENRLKENLDGLNDVPSCSVLA